MKASNEHAFDLAWGLLGNQVGFLFRDLPKAFLFLNICCSLVLVIFCLTIVMWKSQEIDHVYWLSDAHVHAVTWASLLIEKAARNFSCVAYGSHLLEQIATIRCLAAVPVMTGHPRMGCNRAYLTSLLHF